MARDWFQAQETARFGFGTYSKAAARRCSLSIGSQSGAVAGIGQETMWPPEGWTIAVRSGRPAGMCCVSR